VEGHTSSTPPVLPCLINLFNTSSQWTIYTTDPTKGLPFESPPSSSSCTVRTENLAEKQAELLFAPSPIANNLHTAELEIPSVISHPAQFEHLLCNNGKEATS